MKQNDLCRTFGETISCLFHYFSHQILMAMARKSISVPIFLAFFATLAQAQPILQNNVLPNIGDSYQIADSDTFGIFQGNAGPNQTWNLSAMHPIGDTQRVDYHNIAPSATPYVVHYPTSTVATKIEEDTVFYAYFRAQPDQFSFLGSESIVYSQIYSDPDIRLKFPTNFNGSSQDTFTYATDFGAGIVFQAKGSRTTTYDGYGTLTTPLGTFPNSMRIKSVAAYVDSATFGSVQVLTHNELTTYAWLLAEHPDYLAGIYYLKTINETRIPGFDTLFTENPVIKSVSYISETSVGVKDLAPSVEGISDMTLAPVPASDHLILRFNAAKTEKDLQLRLTDAFGRILQTQPLVYAPGENELSLSVGHLPSGAYFLMLTDGRGVLTAGWQKH